MNVFEAANYFMEEPSYYTGDHPDSAETAIVGDEVAWIRKLVDGGYFLKGAKILDYGAGIMPPRNADYLRELGFDVYAYDPGNGADGVDGWEIGKVSKTLPKEHFDVAFTSYVLNVVPKDIQDEIIEDVKIRSDKSFHITRYRDIFDTTKGALNRKDPVTSAFFLQNFADDEQVERYENAELTDDDIWQFCLFGTMTRVKGKNAFQRIPIPEDIQKYGYRSVKGGSAGSKLYMSVGD